MHQNSLRVIIRALYDVIYIRTFLHDQPSQIEVDHQPSKSSLQSGVSKSAIVNHRQSSLINLHITMMQASIALSALLLTKAHGFSIAPFGNPRICRIHPLSVADAVSSDMDIEDVVALLEDPDDLNALLQEDNLLQDAIEALENDGVPVGEDVAAGDEDIDVVAEFLAMVKETPPGSMDNDEVALLRTVMQGLLIENDASDSAQTAQQIETLLFRMLDEYDGAAQTRDRERMKLSAPTSDDFALVSLIRFFFVDGFAVP